MKSAGPPWRSVGALGPKEVILPAAVAALFRAKISLYKTTATTFKRMTPTVAAPAV
jgi:hypothetical protein